MTNSGDAIRPPARNYHGTLLRLGSQGIVIAGQSGSGKTSLALALLERCAQLGTSAALISDDHFLPLLEDGILFGVAPPEIEGKLELPHFGIICAPLEFGNEKLVAITSVFRLDENTPRLPEPASTAILGFDLPLYQLPARNENASTRIVLHILGLPWLKGLHSVACPH